MSKKKNHVEEVEEPEAELVENITQEKAPGAFAVEVEDYVADGGTSAAPGPTIETEPKPVVTDNEFGVDLSGLTPSARERTLEEMRAGAEKVGTPKK